MRDLALPEIDRHRCRDQATIDHFGGVGDGAEGVFPVPSPVGGRLFCVVSTGEGWDHVSVSANKRCPSWAEMEHVKRLFFAEGETAMQLHVPPVDHINAHLFCLHLWRPQKAEIPRPPAWTV